MAFHLLCISHQSLRIPPGALLCPETLNIHISIILIFKSIKWIALDRTNINYLCRDMEIYLVWWVTGGETWMSADLILLSFFCLFFFDDNESFNSSFGLKENSWHMWWGVLRKRYPVFTKGVTKLLTTSELQTVLLSKRLLWMKCLKEQKWETFFSMLWQWASHVVMFWLLLYSLNYGCVVAHIQNQSHTFKWYALLLHREDVRYLRWEEILFNFSSWPWKRMGSFNYSVYWLVILLIRCI